MYECDVADAAAVSRTFEAIKREMGEVEVLVYNAGSGAWGSVEEATVADFETSWRINALGAFLASKQVIPAMKRAGRGSIVFVGATASRKAGPRSAAFSSAKGAQRSLAESMARALWPAGVSFCQRIGAQLVFRRAGSRAFCRIGGALISASSFFTAREQC